jgi:hypothetical protein
MNLPFRGIYQKYIKIILLILLAVLLLFGLAPSQVVNPAKSELASEVFNSVTVLDSYVLTRSGDSYGLHVLVKREADFIPVQIRLPDPSTSYRTMNLTLNSCQHCFFADNKTKAAGIIASLERGELIAYDSDFISDSSFANAGIKLVGLIVDVQGELFLVDGLHVTGGCFWAQE